MGRLLAILVFVIAIIAVFDVWRRENSLEKRLLWTVIIIVFPFLGAMAWYAISRGVIKL